MVEFKHYHRGYSFMAGKKGMRQYGKVIIAEVLAMKEQGRTNREIAEHFGFEKVKTIKNLLERHQRKQRRLEAGITPRPKGRPRKNEVATRDTKDNRIRQLEMEVDLLRAFRSELGRR